MNLGNLILGRLGLYGRLGKNVREQKGVAYYSYSMLQAKLFAGHIAILAGVNPRNIEKAVDGISEEIAKIISEKVPEKELEVAKKNLVGSLSISLDTSIERVSIIHDIQYYDLGLDYLDRYPEIIAGVSADSVRSDLRDCLNPEKISLVAAGPIPELKLDLRKSISNFAA